MKDMFTECISDDVIYIEQIYDVLEGKKKFNFLPVLCIPFLCRTMIAATVSETEHYLNYSVDTYKKNAVVYRDSFLNLIRNPKITQETSVDDCIDFWNKQIQEFNVVIENKKLSNILSRDQIRSFVAMRMIRNAIVHQSWNNKMISGHLQNTEMEARKKFVLEAGFPVDFMKFTKEHWLKITLTRSALSMALNFGPLGDRYNND